MNSQVLGIRGMTCAACAQRIEKTLQKLSGIEQASVNFASEKLFVEYDAAKDTVFVLNPEPLIAAGVDPEKVEGWVYTTVNVEVDGKPTDVYKFLKPFNLQ